MDPYIYYIALYRECALTPGLAYSINFGASFHVNCHDDNLWKHFISCSVLNLWFKVLYWGDIKCLDDMKRLSFAIWCHPKIWINLTKWAITHFSTYWITCQSPEFPHSRITVLRFWINNELPALAHPHQLSTLPEPIFIVLSMRTDIPNQQKDRINFPSVFPVAQAYVRTAFI